MPQRDIANIRTTCIPRHNMTLLTLEPPAYHATMIKKICNFVVWRNCVSRMGPWFKNWHAADVNPKKQKCFRPMSKEKKKKETRRKKRKKENKKSLVTIIKKVEQFTRSLSDKRGQPDKWTRWSQHNPFLSPTLFSGCVCVWGGGGGAVKQTNNKNTLQEKVPVWLRHAKAFRGTYNSKARDNRSCQRHDSYGPWTEFSSATVTWASCWPRS